MQKQISNIQEDQVEQIEQGQQATDYQQYPAQNLSSLQQQTQNGQIDENLTKQIQIFRDNQQCKYTTSCVLISLTLISLVQNMIQYVINKDEFYWYLYIILITIISLSLLYNYYKCCQNNVHSVDYKQFKDLEKSQIYFVRVKKIAIIGFILIFILTGAVMNAQRRERRNDDDGRRILSTIEQHDDNNNNVLSNQEKMRFLQQNTENEQSEDEGFFGSEEENDEDEDEEELEREDKILRLLDAVVRQVFFIVIFCFSRKSLKEYNQIKLCLQNIGQFKNCDNQQTFQFLQVLSIPQQQQQQYQQQQQQQQQFQQQVINSQIQPVQQENIAQGQVVLPLQSVEIQSQTPNNQF